VHWTSDGLELRASSFAFFEAKMISVYTYDLWCMEVLLLNGYNSLDGSTLSSIEEREVKMVETKGRRTVVKSKRSLERRVCPKSCHAVFCR
jgi:hypothetical protein